MTTGYELIAKMRKTRRKNPMTATEQALYNELVAICNDVEWIDVFPCSNYELCNALQISENTLKEARNRLIQAGLIFYKSGKSKRQFSKYSFTVNLLTTSNFEADTATNAATNAATVPATNAADYYKLKEKLKEREARAPDFDEVERVFRQQGGTKEMAQTFFDDYEAIGWMRKGSPIINFARLVGKYITNWHEIKNRSNSFSMPKAGDIYF